MTVVNLFTAWCSYSYDHYFLIVCHDQEKALKIWKEIPMKSSVHWSICRVVLYTSSFQRHLNSVLCYFLITVYYCKPCLISSLSVHNFTSYMALQHLDGKVWWRSFHRILQSGDGNNLIRKEPYRIAMLKTFPDYCFRDSLWWIDLEKTRKPNWKALRQNLLYTENQIANRQIILKVIGSLQTLSQDPAIWFFPVAN